MSKRNPLKLKRKHEKNKKIKREDDALQYQADDEREDGAESALCDFQKQDCPLDLSIQKVETTKDQIEQPYLAEHECMFIPPLGSSVIISGKSGSGKSTLLSNLITSHRFYGPSVQRPNGWFDELFLFSPTANGDDIQKSLNIPKKHVYTDLSEAPQLIEVILNSQQRKLDEAKGANTVKQFAIIFDDVIGDTKFLNDKAFTRCFYQIRHVNATCFICTQHFKRVPRVCRLQANFVFFFQGSAAEVEVVIDEFAPPSYTRKEFRQVVADATREPYSFLTINMKKSWDLRFRRNLDEFIYLDRIASKEATSKCNTSQSVPEQNENKCEDSGKDLDGKYEFVANDYVDKYDERCSEDEQTSRRGAVQQYLKLGK